MANVKITDLTALSGALVDADLFEMVDDVAGTPASRKVTAAVVRNYTSQNYIPGGVLTLESGVPVSTTDQTAKTTVYYTPHIHNVVNLWDGTNWAPTEFTEKSLALGTITSDREYNVYGYLSAGALVLELAAWGSTTVTFTNGTDLVNWTATPAVDGDMFVFNGGTAPTGLVNNTTYYVRDKATDSFKLASTPGGAAINFTTDGSGTITGKLQNVTLQDGRYCKNGDKTRLLLGGFYTTSTTTTEDSAGGGSSSVGAKRYLCNVYNRVARTVAVYDGTASWTNPGTTIRQVRATAGNKIEVFDCLGTGQIALSGKGLAAFSQTGSTFENYNQGIGVDVTTAYSTGNYGVYGHNINADRVVASTTTFQATVPLGRHAYNWVENTGGVLTTVTVFGNNGATLRTGVTGSVTT